jgi:hypothetical protein
VAIATPTTSVGQPAAKPAPKRKPKAAFKPPVPKPKPAPCYAVSVAPRSLTIGPNRELRLRVTANNKVVAGARLELKGPAILILSGRTGAAGWVTVKLSPKQPGILMIKPAGHTGCASARVGVTAAFAPPVTG